MPMTLEQIAAEALNLPTPARAELADQLFESLDPADLNLIDRLWLSETSRRLDELTKRKVETIPDEAVVA